MSYEAEDIDDRGIVLVRSVPAQGGSSDRPRKWGAYVVGHGWVVGAYSAAKPIVRKLGRAWMDSHEYPKPEGLPTRVYLGGDR